MPDDRVERQAQVLTQVALVYQMTLDHHGPTPAGVCWSDGAGQVLRFDLLTKGIDSTRPVSINDVGCGYGALFGFMAERFRLSGYCGTDICEAMVEAAARRVTAPTASFVQSAVPVAPADWSLASGTFNMTGGADLGEWRDLVRTVLMAMARNSRVGLAFNLLRSNRGDDLLWGDEPGEWERFCRDRLGGRCEVDIHPDGGEWTLRVRL